MPEPRARLRRRALASILSPMWAVIVGGGKSVGAREWLLPPSGLRLNCGVDGDLGAAVSVSEVRPHHEPFAGRSRTFLSLLRGPLIGNLYLSGRGSPRCLISRLHSCASPRSVSFGSASAACIRHVEVRFQDTSETGLIQDDHVIQAFPTNRADPSLNVGDLPERLRCVRTSRMPRQFAAS